ncbi:restriction endonuclease subunit S [Chloracidobacterium thermophilum]|uniref:restriction endonuclease subunit S n=1 Tax=Chloracidobacterium thermophilum TaxID=458033 RepID=UPI00073870C1|nr:restriction endonuclease subunit S [Chloracidobacterium thermophilum]
MNETLEEMARAIFKSWFVDFDPVRAKAVVRREHPDWTNAQVSRAACPNLKPEIAELFPDRLVDSELGGIPEGWEVQSFTDDVEVIGGGTPRTSNPEYWGGDIPWFSVVDTPADGEVFVIYTEKNITQDGVDNSSTCVLPVGTTIISARGTVGNIALVGVPMAMNQSCYGLHDLRGHNGYFLYFATAAVVETLRHRTHGSVFNTITRDTLKSVRVVAPPNALIVEFECIIGAMLQRILSALHESRTLAALRDALLPKLISGEIRVKDAERFLKERGL